MTGGEPIGAKEFVRSGVDLGALAEHLRWLRTSA